jgi:hypothetical protein
MAPVRGRRFRSNNHRPGARFAAPPPGATDGGTAGTPDDAFLDIDSASPAEAGADALIAAYRLGAYSEARQRQAQAEEAAARWDAVASIIARREEKHPGTGPVRRGEIEAHFASGRGASPPGSRRPFPEINPMGELQRILAEGSQRFRLQFFGVATDRGPAILSEADIPAADASDAIRAATERPWPARAVGLRILDREGREIFERLKADRR